VTSRAHAAQPPLGIHARSLRRPPTWTIVLGLTAVFLSIAGWQISVHWPYRYREVHPLVEDIFGSRIKISHYHRTYFPHPGFIATAITITRESAPDLPPIGSVQTLSVEGRWGDLFLLRRRVHLVEMTGLHVVLPPLGSAASRADFPPGSAKGFGGPHTAIEVLRIHNSLLDILHDSGARYTFAVHELEITGLLNGQPMHYWLAMENPLPSGQITVTGNFGPLNANDVGATNVSGQFSFNRVRLRDVGNIRGTLSSSGRFSGPLRAIQADATSDTPDFAVDDGQPTNVQGTIHCIVNGLTGDVFMPQIEVKSDRTTVHASGEVAGSPKTANLDIAIQRGRAEDVLRPFLHRQVPIVGPVALHGHAYVGPSGRGIPFLQRLRVNGVFDVPSERLADAKTEQTLTAFSQRAQSKKTQATHQEDPPQQDSEVVLSSLRGPAVIRNGVISTTGLLFQVPGAQADLAGTFALHGEAVHLTGNLEMQTNISHTATGFKALLLKPLAPFFKKQDRGAVIPIAVLGTPGHYQVTHDLSHRK
jgi:hypothetical protein